MNHLLLWRHAHAGRAGEGPDDLQRPLSAQGRRDAKRVAAWLRPRLPSPTLVLCSPAVRAQQTAAALAQHCRTLEALAPQADVAMVWAALASLSPAPDEDAAVIVVGHQPTLGQLAARLLTGTAADWTLKKGAVWWLQRRPREGRGEILLRAVVAPDLL